MVKNILQAGGPSLWRAIGHINAIYYRKNISINILLKLGNSKQYKPIVFDAFIISLKLFRSYVCLNIYCLHWENSYSISFQIEWDMILVTVFLSIFGSKWNFIRLKIGRKTVTTIISNSIWKGIITRMIISGIYRGNATAS